MLLGLRQVQDELALSDSQKKELRELADKAMAGMREQFGALRDLEGAERDKKAAELRTKAAEQAKDLEKKAKAILTEDQQKRLQEIVVQVQGIRSLSNEDIAKALGLTADQQAKLKTIQDESRDAMQKAFSGMRDLPEDKRREAFRAMGEKMQKMRTDTEAKTKAVLTADQLKKLDDLKGKEFKLDPSAFRPQGRGRGGRAPGEAKPPAPKA